MEKRCHNCGNVHEEPNGYCAPCSTPVMYKKLQEKLETSKLERARGYSDALAGHGPALFGGPYMVGYRRGRAEIGQPMEHKPAKEEPPDDTWLWNLISSL